MANERFPNDPFHPKLSDDDFGRASRLDNEVPPDPVLQEGRASTGRVALFAVALALVLGAVFYGLNNTTINNAGTTPPSQSAQQTQPNSQPGTTTGSAMKRPTPPASGPSGTEIDRSANSPTK
ncbi:MAG: hypothetical protein E6G93_09430 [Alphaproteobacteria bacterium]|nr:MAG: hypothetical protein E6G93_09430 [Alphaproteobacteria bacterium]